MILKDVIKLDERFQTSVNIRFDIDKISKIDEFIPAKSTLNVLESYLENIFEKKNNKSTLLVGPYGKGKSHLLLVLLALLCKSKDETAEIQKKIIEADNSTKLLFMELAEVGRPFLPVIVSSFQGDLNESFIFALQEALKKAGIRDLPLPSEYSEAVRTMES